ncbi:MAG: peptidoglycan DD-metalloendopeptidase family protein [Clostridiales Family XIII bacterium]|nr:peptidoglycan DD-metalloendopeptidase family protein [Clostridiales Family XIII bacterium]
MAKKCVVLLKGAPDVGKKAVGLARRSPAAVKAGAVRVRKFVYACIAFAKAQRPLVKLRAAQVQAWGKRVGAWFVHAQKIAFKGFLLFLKRLTQVKKATVIRLSGSAAGAVAVTVVALVIVNSHAVGVTIDGQKVGYVADEETFAALVEDVKEELSHENADTDIVIDEQKIALADSIQNTKKIDYIDVEDLKDTLLESEAVVASAYAITVDEKPLLNIATEKDAQSLLDGIVQQYTGNDPAIQFAWQENIKVENVSVELDSLVSTPAAITYLLTGNEKVDVYSVVEGDTIWGISQAKNIPIEEISSANPTLNIESIHVGDQIKMNKLDPFVHLQTTQTAIEREPIDFPVEEEKTDSLYVGQKKVKEEGVKGEREVTREYVKVNGEVVNIVELASVTLTEPKTQIELVGVKPKPARISYAPASGSYVGGNGILSNPMARMELSSGYGGARRHKGADFRNPQGTPIYAAAEGTVTFAGWYAGYGYLVKINHGGGLETWYAHCSVLNVTGGEYVGRGQQIAQVGSTGQSTGYHLHFEVRVNGTPQNPLSYL